MFWPNIIVGKDFICSNNLMGNVVVVSKKGLKGNHHVIADIVIMCVILNLLGEDFTGVYDARYVLQIDIFGLVGFTNQFLLEFEVFYTF